jgi:hypothetical protein
MFSSFFSCTDTTSVINLSSMSSRYFRTFDLAAAFVLLSENSSVSVIFYYRLDSLTFSTMFLNKTCFITCVFIYIIYRFYTDFSLFRQIKRQDTVFRLCFKGCQKFIFTFLYIKRTR